MANWTDVAGYLRTNYKIMQDEGTLLKLLFDVGGGRSQSILVTRSTMDFSKQEWAVISSPFATVDQVDLSTVLKLAEDFVVGGIGAYGDVLVVKHAVPLGDLDFAEFDEPFQLVLHTADHLERSLGVGDRF